MLVGARPSMKRRLPPSTDSSDARTEDPCCNTPIQHPSECIGRWFEVQSFADWRSVNQALINDRPAS